MTGLGDCFPTAGRLALADPELVLVHGLVWSPDHGYHPHAWVERTTTLDFPGYGPVESVTVIDQSNGKDGSWPRELYLKVGRVRDRDVHRYTATEARVRMLDTGHWGPWKDQEATA